MKNANFSDLGRTSETFWDAVFLKLEVTPVRYSHKVENVHVLFRTNSDFVQNKSQNFCSVKTIEHTVGHSDDYTDDYDDIKID